MIKETIRLLKEAAPPFLAAFATLVFIIVATKVLEFIVDLEWRDYPEPPKSDI